MLGPVSNGHGSVNSFEIPGIGSFVDATAVLEDASEDLEEGELVTISGFDLNDAMAALEVMDVRMDSGLLPEAPPFDPNMLLLPEEVCWILDRTFAFEVGWHNGLALGQTVYTIRYVHYLADIDLPRFKPPNGHGPHPPVSKPDPDRPPELVSLVLRAGIFGLMKCCDLVWRELSQNRVYEGEDWNGDKFNLSLCENIQPKKVISLLSDALSWLHQTPTIPNVWRSALTDRILFRKNILQMLSTPSASVLHNAKQDLYSLLSRDVSVNPSHRAANAIDPNIIRHLISSIPVRTVALPSQKEVWATWKTWLAQWEESRGLIGTESLWRVKLLIEMRAYEHKFQRRTPFLRSLGSSIFFDGSKILYTHEPTWLVDRFFHETACVPPGLLPEAVQQLTDTLLHSFNHDDYDASTDEYLRDDLKKRFQDGVDTFEKTMHTLLVLFFTSFYHNRARQRRMLAQSLLEWHLAYEQAGSIVSYLRSNEPLESYCRIPLSIRYMRLLMINQVILSGFELELYTRTEWAMMYWYLAEVLAIQKMVLTDIHLSLRREDHTPDIIQSIEFVISEKEYVNGLYGISIAFRDIFFHTIPYPTTNAQQEQDKFRIRFKWAFVKGYFNAQGPDEDRPILGKWRRWCMQNEGCSSWQTNAAEALKSSGETFARLASTSSENPSAVLCMDEYQQFLTSLSQICHVNTQTLTKTHDVTRMDRIRCLWTRSKWFPVLDTST